jgi:hypothetical protein
MIPQPKLSKWLRCRPRASNEDNQPNSNARRAITDTLLEGLLDAAQASGLRKLIHRCDQGFAPSTKKKG